MGLYLCDLISACTSSRSANTRLLHQPTCELKITGKELFRLKPTSCVMRFPSLLEMLQLWSILNS